MGFNNLPFHELNWVLTHFIRAAVVIIAGGKVIKSPAIPIAIGS